MTDLAAAVLSEPLVDGTCRHCGWTREPYEDPPSVCNACAQDLAVAFARQIRETPSACAIAMIAVSEDNRRLRANWQWEMKSRAVCLVEIDQLRADVARRDALLDACADRVAETAQAHREQDDAIVLRIGLAVTRLDLLASSCAGRRVRRILDEVRADLRAIATTKGTP